MSYYRITKWLELKFLRLGLSLLSKRKQKFLKITQKEFKFKFKCNNIFKFKYNFKNVLATFYAYYNGCKVNRDALGAQHKLATLNLVGWMKKKVQDFPKPVLYCIPISNLPKGQLISKGLVVILNSSKKWTKKST